jgi:hypothetical protein
MFSADQVNKFVDEIEALLPEDRIDGFRMLSVAWAHMAVIEGYTDDVALAVVGSALQMTRETAKKQDN